jgi:hypothetical protein
MRSIGNLILPLTFGEWHLVKSDCNLRGATWSPVLILTFGGLHKRHVVQRAPKAEFRLCNINKTESAPRRQHST